MGKLHEALRKAGDKPGAAAAAPTASAPTAAPADAAGGAIAGAAAAQKAVAASYAGALYRGESDPHLVPLAQPHSPLSEQYRTLRTNLLAQASVHNMKVFVVTSSLPGEGKSISSSNLACVLAEDPEKKVVLIDADMRKPTLHRLFGIDNHRGLSDYLAGGSMLEMALQRSRLPNLWVLPAGHVPQNPTELLAGKRMEDLLTRLRRDYDWIVVDTPPVVSTTDAAILSPRADGTLLVVRMERTQRDVVKHAVELLRKGRGNVVGTILTGLSGDVEGYYGKSAGAA
jgi:capsular exopolysaccharide synthesis family protein